VTSRARISPGLVLLVVGVAVAGIVVASSGSAKGEWPGVDEAVIGRFVAEAGRPPPRAVIDWVRGDALLFAFLSAGLVAGFLLGFWSRALFVERVGIPNETNDHV
jgi:cobalt/nickel transport protein